MKMFMLMVLFSTAETPAPHSVPGYGPREAPSMAECLDRRSRMQGYFESQLPKQVQFKVFCVEFQALGYEEALTAFRREIGEEM